MSVSKPAASVIALLSDKIDHMECSVARRIDDLGAHLGDRLADLTAKVNTQNGRVGKLENGQHELRAKQDAIHASVRAVRPSGLDKRQIGLAFGGGGVAGAVVLEVVKHWLAQ